jgi:hypothetical protein
MVMSDRFKRAGNSPNLPDLMVQEVLAALGRSLAPGAG